MFVHLFPRAIKTFIWDFLQTLQTNSENYIVKYVNCFGFFVVVVVVLKSNASLLTSKVCPVFNFMTYKSVLNCEKNAIGPSIIETSFIAIRRIWIFVGNIAAFCLDIIQK